MIPEHANDVPTPSPDSIARIRKNILHWYRFNGRDFPWRASRDPYLVMVSEFMLQQTQASRVALRLPEWLEMFPDIRSLASASRREILIAWSGLGYNRRALALHDTARAIMERFEGQIPQDVQSLLSLPGIGAYTANAVLCFAFRRRVVVVDVNVQRIVSRLFRKQRSERDMESEAWVRCRAEKLLPARAFYNWNQALMDFGATVCTARTPACDRCPVQTPCSSSGEMNTAVRHTHSEVRETPRRIYRGKIVESLRRAPGHTISAKCLLQSLYGDDVSKFDHLKDALSSLQRDELLCLHGNVNDPAGLLVQLAE